MADLVNLERLERRFVAGHPDVDDLIAEDRALRELVRKTVAALRLFSDADAAACALMTENIDDTQAALLAAVVDGRDE